MELEYLGHACIALIADGRTLIVDPYESGQFDGQMAYRPIDVPADWVVCSHRHIDHCATGAVPGPALEVTEGEAGPFRIARQQLYHDEAGGRRRGGEVSALRIDADGVSILHLSDVGESPRLAVVEANRHVDILLIPTGGFFTIGAAQAWEWIERIQPRTAIPLHYQTSACRLPLRGVDVFGGWCADAVVWNSRRIQVQETLPDRLILMPRLV